jgi:Flp pilus assembly protein TadD
MRKLIHVLAAFSSAATFAAFIAGCEEETPPSPRAISVNARPVATPTVNETDLGVPEVKPTAPIAKVEQKPTPKIDEDFEGTSTDVIIEDARSALEANEINRALKLAKIAVQKSPQRSSAWNTLGRAQLRVGQRKSAVTSFEKAADLNPSSSWALNNLGLALIYEGRYEDAVDALEEATNMESVQPYMWNNLGMAYEHLDRLDDARDAYKQAKAMDHSGASENLARLQGVKSVFKTAKLDTKKQTPDTDPIDGVIPDAGE